MQVPRYHSQRQLRLSSAVQQPLTNPALRGMEQFGEVANREFERIQKEQDAADALVADKTLRDSWREHEKSLYLREGKNARGVVNDASQWLEERKKEIAEGLTRSAQQTLEPMFQSFRARQLDALGRHELTQHISYKKQTIDSILGEIKRSAAEDPFNVAATERELRRGRAAMETLFRGQNHDAVFAEFRADALNSQVLLMIQEDPYRAEEYLEQWKGEIGTDNYRRAKAALEKGKVEADTKAGYVLYKEQFTLDDGTVDYAGAIEALNNDDSELDKDIRGAIKRVFKTEWEERRLIDSQARKAMEDKVFNNAAGLIRDGKLTEARAVVANSDLSETKKLAWERALTNPQEESDPEVYTQTTVRVLSKNINQDDIVRLIGNGLTANDGIKLVNTLQNERYQSGAYKTAFSYGKDTLLSGGLLDKKSPQDVERFKNFVDDLNDALEGGVSEGKNWNDMLDKDHKDYVVDKVLKPLVLTDMERIAEQRDALLGNENADVPRRKPGETINEYLKRTK